jgi:hypothetical protein
MQLPPKELEMTVKCNPDGSLTITASARESASLAGRENFGGVAGAQADLKERIADAWYAAGCPTAEN